MDLCNGSLGIMAELSIPLLPRTYSVSYYNAGKKCVKRKSLCYTPFGKCVEKRTTKRNSQ